MIFNSIEFGIFYTLVFVIYWAFFSKNIWVRNLFIIATSYFFYGFWDWRFLGLIIISSLGDFVFGIQIGQGKDKRIKKRYLLASIILNLGILCFFKYFNFFIDSWVDGCHLLNIQVSITTLQIILPVGISFYTFQTLSYTIDIYRNQLKPTRDIWAFLAFVSFFPQLVAGPIERAKKLLPQFFTIHQANYQSIKLGLLDVAIGLFKKIVIADRLAVFVDGTFNQMDGASGLPMTMGVLFFAFQLYFDFSAYSQMAIGVARTLGFELTTNFRRPYLSSSFSEFWKRWHISLSSWFKDYVYIPLGGNRSHTRKTIFNVFIVFVLSGLWHGASWNFVIWGFVNGLFLVLLDRYLIKNKIPMINCVLVGALWSLSLVFFRSQTFTQSIQVLNELGFSNSSNLYSFGLNKFEFNLSIGLLIFAILLELIEEKKGDILSVISTKSVLIRYFFYVSLIASILAFGVYGDNLNDSKFIYFQF